MRKYANISPLFWTGDTGRFLRNHPDAQRIALYLITCPSAEMTGLFYIPLNTICHEVGSPSEGASKGHRRGIEWATKGLLVLENCGFCSYDVASETVFVFEMAKWQIGEVLKHGDKRFFAISSMIELYRKSRFFNDFLDRYADKYSLIIERNIEGASKGLARGIEGASKGLIPPSPPITPSYPLQSKAKHEHEHSQSKAEYSDGVAAGPPTDSNPPPAKPASKPKASGGTPATGPHAEVIEIFCSGWQEVYGEKYPFNAGKDGATIKWILGCTLNHVGKAREAIDRFFADRSEFTIETRHSLGTLRSCFAKYLAAPIETKAKIIPPRVYASD